MKGIILFGHGARNPEYIQPFKRIQAVVAAKHLPHRPTAA